MARKRQETLVLFKDVLNITEKFSDAQFGALMRAAFDYRFEGEGYQGEDALVELAFGCWKRRLTATGRPAKPTQKMHSGKNRCFLR